MAEDPDQPDLRWDVLVKLISKIMSGNALALADFLLDVVGAWFNKNAEKLGATFALRNLGIEESLMRISAALVFETVLPRALQQHFLTDFDLGAGRPNGAEAFGRLAALFASMGAPIAVFDIIKAFNNLRRKDIMAAVAAFNHPLLSAFVHFMFSRDSKVTFTCPITGQAFNTWLTKGIHQGNPLSVFIFCLTIAFILKPFRQKYPDALIPAFVDDLQFAMPPSSLESFPEALQEFISLFQEHGLRFDLSDDAKSSVFTTAPLPVSISEKITKLHIRCQTKGIAPCKVPCGSPAYMEAFVDKATTKLRERYKAFQDLLPALVALDRTRKHPTHNNFEHFLNLVRLSFLSMTTYVLRTLIPSYCVAYRCDAKEMALNLIQKVLPRFVELPSSSVPNLLRYPDFQQLSQRIMQLPLTLGGLSLRLPDSISDIAYAASATDCLPVLQLAAKRFRVPFTHSLIPELLCTRLRVSNTIPSVDEAFWTEAEDPDPDKDAPDQPLQHRLTALFNSAEITSMVGLLQPWPLFRHVFSARTDKAQQHVSWALNPKTRAFYGLPMLPDAEFSRTIALAILHPIVLPRSCPCGGMIDPVGLHLLHCKQNHYGCLHDRVKHAVAARIRSLMHADTAAFSVLVEQPMLAHFGLRNAAQPEGTPLIADLVLSMHTDLQMEPIACDFVSCLVSDKRNYPDVLEAAARFKRRKYYKYQTVSENGFFPLPFGRTNVMSTEVLQFCTLIGNHLPPRMRGFGKILASFSRAIYSGTAQTFNLAFRRLQLSAAQHLPLASFPFASLRDPYALESRSRANSRIHRRAPFADAPLIVTLAAALADSCLWPSPSYSSSSSSFCSWPSPSYSSSSSSFCSWPSLS